MMAVVINSAGQDGTVENKILLNGLGSFWIICKRSILLCGVRGGRGRGGESARLLAGACDGVGKVVERGGRGGERTEGGSAQGGRVRGRRMGLREQSHSRFAARQYTHGTQLPSRVPYLSSRTQAVYGPARAVNGTQRPILRAHGT